MFTLTASTGSPRSADYRAKREVGEVDCYYVVNRESPYGDWALREVVEPAGRALELEYGVRLRPLAYGEIPARRPGCITYVIYGPTNPLEMPAHERSYLATLAAAGVRTNIVSAYPLTPAGEDRSDYGRAGTVVPELCDALDVNVIFPDELNLDVGIRTSTWQDVFINAIGETIRLKFHPTESVDPDDLAVWARLCREHASDVAELATLFREHHLWQRKPHTDGSVMFAHDGHWFISQTVTDKTLMTAEDFDLITSFDDAARTVTYAGPRLPSSDAPEFLRLCGMLGMHGTRPGLVVHFHHRELTRGTRHRELVTAQPIEGGRFAAGREYFHHMRATSSNWLIVREHGVVWAGDSVAEFGDFVRRVVSRGP